MVPMPSLISRLIISALPKPTIANFGIVSGFYSVTDKKQKETFDVHYLKERNIFIFLTYFQRFGRFL